MLRKEMISLAHANHDGIWSCFRRLREEMYWPGIIQMFT